METDEGGPGYNMFTEEESVIITGAENYEEEDELVSAKWRNFYQLWPSETLSWAYNEISELKTITKEGRQFF